MALSSITDDADAQDTTPLKTLWANVGSDGFLKTGKGATRATKTGTDSYDVRFEQGVIGCVYPATLRRSAGKISVDTAAYFAPTAGNRFVRKREVALFTRDGTRMYTDG